MCWLLFVIDGYLTGVHTYQVFVALDVASVICFGGFLVNVYVSAIETQ